MSCRECGSVECVDPITELCPFCMMEYEQECEDEEDYDEHYEEDDVD